MAYEQALRANPNSIQAMNAISLILRTREEFPKAVEYLQAILKLDQHNGEVWGSVGECHRHPSLRRAANHQRRALLSYDG